MHQNRSVALRDTTITRAPAADSSSAASRPIPRPPPVTSATRPFIPQLSRIRDPFFALADTEDLHHQRRVDKHMWRNGMVAHCVNPCFEDPGMGEHSCL